MRGYRIFKDGKKGYRFELLPNNNKTQRIGQSCIYKSKSDCQEAIKEFGSFVKVHGLGHEDHEKVIVKKIENGKYVYEYIKEGRKIFYRADENGYGVKKNCVDIIGGIYKYIDDYTTIEVDY